MMRPGGLSIKRIRDSAPTLLPEPDSPTIPSTSPAATSYENAIHGFDDTAVAEERRLQVLHRQQRLGCRGWLGGSRRDNVHAVRLRFHRGNDYSARERGSSASRNPSPRKLKANTVSAIISPGKTPTHQAP